MKFDETKRGHIVLVWVGFWVASSVVIGLFAGMEWGTVSLIISGWLS